MHATLHGFQPDRQGVFAVERIVFRVCVLLFVPAMSLAQEFVELRIEGPDRVLERQTSQYRAFAVFDDGGEFEVTLPADWSLDRDFYATIDNRGRLTTREVPRDVAIIVLAEYTWREVTHRDTHDVTIFDIPPDNIGPDPWPTWGRTTTRLSNTTTIGPQTPRIAWSLSSTVQTSAPSSARRA